MMTRRKARSAAALGELYHDRDNDNAATDHASDTDDADNIESGSFHVRKPTSKTEPRKIRGKRGKLQQAQHLALLHANVADQLTCVLKADTSGPFLRQSSEVLGNRAGFTNPLLKVML